MTPTSLISLLEQDLEAKMQSLDGKTASTSENNEFRFWSKASAWLHARTDNLELRVAFVEQPQSDRLLVTVEARESKSLPTENQG